MRNIKTLKINMYLKKSRKGEHKDFLFSFPVLRSQVDINELLNSQVNLKSYMVFLSFGGYLLVVMIIAVALLLIGTIFGIWFQIASMLLTLSLIILAVNLNSRLSQLIFDFVNEDKMIP